MSRKPTVPRPGPRRAKRWVSPLALPILRMDWRASSQPVGWVERSETHHPATRTPPRKAMGFAFGSTPPTDWLQPVGWVERSETHHPATHTPPRKRWVSTLALPILRTGTSTAQNEQKQNR